MTRDMALYMIEENQELHGFCRMGNELFTMEIKGGEYCFQKRNVYTDKTELLEFKDIPLMKWSIENKVRCEECGYIYDGEPCHCFYEMYPDA